MEEDILRAAGEGDEGTVIRLLDTDLGLLEGGNGNGDTPLIEATRHGRLEMVRLLKQRGANINALGRWGRTALHWAADEGHEAVVAFLTSNGAHADTRDVVNMTPFMYGCFNGHLGVVQMLLQHTGARRLNDTDGRGQTALHHAARCGRDKVVNLLLSEGAQASIRDRRGSTPLMLACSQEHWGVMMMLLQHLGGQGLDVADENGHTALHYAVMRDLEWVVSVLLLAGADSRFRDNEGKTPRRLAKEREHWGGEWTCTEIFQWWDDELERSYVLARATCLHKAYTTQRDQPTSQVSTYLEARVAAGHAVPRVEAVVPQSKRQSQQREEEVHAVLDYVMQGLNEELLTELLEGFHSSSFPENDQEEDDSDDEEAYQQDWGAY